MSLCRTRNRRSRGTGVYRAVFPGEGVTSPYVDRIGSEYGTYMAVAPDGVPVSFEARGLNNTSLGKEFYQYQFTGDLPDGWHIETSTVAPAAGRPGGAIQVEVYDSEGAVVGVKELIKEGVLQPR